MLVQDKEGRTPLHLFAREGSLPKNHIHHDSIFFKDKNGQTPLSLALSIALTKVSYDNNANSIEALIRPVEKLDTSIHPLSPDLLCKIFVILLLQHRFVENEIKKIDPLELDLKQLKTIIDALPENTKQLAIDQLKKYTYDNNSLCDNKDWNSLMRGLDSTLNNVKKDIAVGAKQLINSISNVFKSNSHSSTNNQNFQL